MIQHADAVDAVLRIKRYQKPDRSVKPALLRYKSRLCRIAFGIPHQEITDAVLVNHFVVVGAKKLTYGQILAQAEHGYSIRLGAVQNHEQCCTHNDCRRRDCDAPLERFLTDAQAKDARDSQGLYRW